MQLKQVLETVNPNIEFDNSPFYLQRELSPWSAPAGHPRRAMINSFGAGGVNSCLVLEDYEPPEGGGVCVRKRSYLVVLSAKNERRLRESATRLRDHLSAQRNVDLDRSAYTLQVGREAMDERLAVVVASVDELLSELTAYVAGAASSKLAVGRVEPHRKKKLAKQEERERQKSLFERGDLDALAQMWIEGRSIEWDDLYVVDRPYRLPLPTYPTGNRSFPRPDSWRSPASTGRSRARRR